MLAKLDSAGAFDAFKDWLTKNPQLDVQVQRESDYYAEQSKTLTQTDSEHRLRRRVPDGPWRHLRRGADDVLGGRDAHA